MTDRILTPQQELYLLKCNEYYKIGITGNIRSRLNSLRTGNPYKIELLLSVPMKYAEVVEERLHDGLKEYKHFREWFKLDEIDEYFVHDLKQFLISLSNYEKA